MFFIIIQFSSTALCNEIIPNLNTSIYSFNEDIIFDEMNSIRLDRLEGLLQVVSDTSTKPGRELIPVATNGLRLLISKKGSEVRKKLLLSLIKNDEFDLKEMQGLIKIITKRQPPCAWPK